MSHPIVPTDSAIDPSPVIRPFSRRQRPVSVYDLPLDALRERIEAEGQPGFRAQQVWDWVYGRKVTSWQEMKNLPGSLRTDLEESLPLSTMKPVQELVTDNGDTYKLLYETFDGQLVETVLMLYRDRATVCVSCQVGCAVGCAFCATGLGGLTRNLTAGEMVRKRSTPPARRGNSVGR